MMKTLAAGGMTMVVVAHAMQFATQVADRVIVIDRGAIIKKCRSKGIFGEALEERSHRFFWQLEWEKDGRPRRAIGAGSTSGTAPVSKAEGHA
jgi:energy-coupling factor transporter ATP-binding protein EcfA2